MLLSSWLALRRNNQTAQAAQLRWLYLVDYSAWGVIVGLGLWSHLLVTPFIFFSALLLFCRHDLRTKAGLFLLLGLIVGSLPLISYNVTAPMRENSLAVFMQLHQTAYSNAPSGMLLWLKQLAGTFFYSLPMATDMFHLSNQNVLPLYSSWESLSLSITLLYSCWSVGYVALLVSSTWLTFRSICKLGLNKSLTQLEMEKKQSVLLIFSACRLMLL